MLTRRAFAFQVLAALAFMRDATAWRYGRFMQPITLVLTVDGASPSITYDFRTMPLPDDIIEIRDDSVVIGSYTITQTDIDNGSYTTGQSPLASGSHVISARHKRGAQYSDWSNAVTVTV